MLCLKSSVTRRHRRLQSWFLGRLNRESVIFQTTLKLAFGVFTGPSYGVILTGSRLGPKTHTKLHELIIKNKQNVKIAIFLIWTARQKVPVTRLGRRLQSWFLFRLVRKSLTFQTNQKSASKASTTPSYGLFLGGPKNNRGGPTGPPPSLNNFVKKVGFGQVPRRKTTVRSSRSSRSPTWAQQFLIFQCFLWVLEKRNKTQNTGWAKIRRGELAKYCTAIDKKTRMMVASYSWEGIANPYTN